MADRTGRSRHPQTAATARSASGAPSGWALLVGLIVGAGVVLGAASFGWVGTVVIVAVLAGAYLLALRWARWARPDPSSR